MIAEPEPYPQSIRGRRNRAETRQAIRAAAVRLYQTLDRAATDPEIAAEVGLHASCVGKHRRALCDLGEWPVPLTRPFMIRQDDREDTTTVSETTLKAAAAQERQRHFAAKRGPDRWDAPPLRWSPDLDPGTASMVLRRDWRARQRRRRREREQRSGDKECAKCGVAKSRAEFSRRRYHSVDGLQSYCKACWRSVHRQYNRTRRERDRERKREQESHHAQR